MQTLKVKNNNMIETNQSRNFGTEIFNQNTPKPESHKQEPFKAKVVQLGAVVPSNPYLNKPKLPPSQQQELLSINPGLNSFYQDYLFDIFINAQKEENYYQIKHDYVKNSNKFNEKFRTILVEWLIQIAELMNICKQGIYMAINIMDRFLEKEIPHKNQIQLLGAAALFISSKIELIYPPSVDELCVLTDNSYLRDDIIEYENYILKLLDYDVLAVTAHHFLNIYQVFFGQTQLKFRYFNSNTQIIQEFNFNNIITQLILLISQSISEKEKIFCIFLYELCLHEYPLIFHAPSLLSLSFILFTNQLLNSQNQSVLLPKFKIIKTLRVDENQIDRLVKIVKMVYEKRGNRNCLIKKWKLETSINEYIV